jgi:precorrin-6x reductase
MAVKKLFLFGGTTEGRLLCDYLEQQQLATVVFVATEYGRELLPQSNPWLEIHCGRLNQAEMLQLLQQEQPLAVLDATHPYATAVTENIFQACLDTKIPYYRILRPAAEQLAGCHYVASIAELLAYLQQREGIIFSTLGSKELPAFAALPHYEERLVVRVLPNQEAMDQCAQLHLQGRQIIGMQGPFSREMNRQMFQEWQADILVTKESGKAGGFLEKIQAAQDCGMEIVILARPRLEQGFTLTEIQEQIQQLIKESENTHQEA